MNAERAQEIADSPDMINVTYNNVPIYIQNVNEGNETARVYPLDDPEHEQEVSLSQLKEQ